MKTITEQSKWNLIAGGNDPKNDVIPASVGYGLEEGLQFAVSEITRLETELERTKQERNAIAKNVREPLLLKLDQANERINTLIHALVPLVEMWEWFNNDAENSEAGTQVGAYYGFYKNKYEKWDAAIAVLKREEVK